MTTTDMSGTIEPKSDQLNADDLIAGPRTITITRVDVGKGDQPVSIHYEGENGRPYKPGKSMRRVMVEIWGAEGAKYVGQRMTLYRDPDITFGPDTVGGIRISHMTGISRMVEMPLTVKRGSRKRYVVEPLVELQATLEDARGWIQSAEDKAALERIWKSRAMGPFREQLQGELDARKAALEPKREPPQDSDGFDAP